MDRRASWGDKRHGTRHHCKWLTRLKKLRDPELRFWSRTEPSEFCIKSFACSLWATCVCLQRFKWLLIDDRWTAFIALFATWTDCWRMLMQSQIFVGHKWLRLQWSGDTSGQNILDHLIFLTTLLIASTNHINRELSVDTTDLLQLTNSLFIAPHLLLNIAPLNYHLDVRFFQATIQH